MSLHDVLKSHTIATLRKEVANANMHRYARLQKAQLIAVMAKYPDRFSHLQMRVKPKQIRVNKAKPYMLPPAYIDESDESDEWDSGDDSDGFPDPPPEPEKTIDNVALLLKQKLHERKQTINKISDNLVSKVLSNTARDRASKNHFQALIERAKQDIPKPKETFKSKVVKVFKKFRKRNNMDYWNKVDANKKLKEENKGRAFEKHISPTKKQIAFQKSITPKKKGQKIQHIVV